MAATKIAPALAAGNTVLLKPASDTVLVAWELCQCFWRAGVSRKALQFVPCSGGKEGRRHFEENYTMAKMAERVYAVALEVCRA